MISLPAYFAKQDLQLDLIVLSFHHLPFGQKAEEVCPSLMGKRVVVSGQMQVVE